MRREEGAAGALIAVVLAFVTLLILAFVSLTRTATGSGDRETTTARLAAAGAALEGYASASYRLPCPADPASGDGAEVTNGAARCQFDQGTLPWKTIGMRRDDSFDAWGRKISYRVYTGNAGSFTQPGGVSMANCDTHEAFSTGATSTAGGSGGLCKPDPNTVDPATRTTTPAEFLAGKGLYVSDFGTDHTDVAFVLVSHGVTGLGGYTASGTQLNMPPMGPERDNTGTGDTLARAFKIQAFSGADVGATDPAHFDDLLLYRGIEDLAKRANLAARNWPDTILSAVVFDRTTVRAALGGTNPGADTGRSTIAFNNATVSAFDSGGAQNISFVASGTDGIGGVNGGDGLLGSAGGEGLRIDFAEDARQFAFTLDNFDDASPTLHERVELRFFEVVNNTATLKSTVVKQTCVSNGKVASYSLDVCASFNRVEIRPVTMSDGTSPSDFKLAEIRTCVDSVTCQTSLQASGNVCSTKVFTPCSIGISDPSTMTITLVNPSTTAMSGATLADSYPLNLVNAAIAGATTTCVGGTVTAANGGTSVALSGAALPARSSCTVTVSVTSATPGAYDNSTGDVTTASSATIASVSGSLRVLLHPAVAKSFAPALVPQNSPSLLAYTLTNSNATEITDIAFTETLPSGLVNIAGAGGPAATCGGAVNAVDGTSVVSFSGGTIPPGGTCTISVSVTSATAGTYVSTLAAGAVTSGNAGANLSTATASLTVN